MGLSQAGTAAGEQDFKSRRWPFIEPGIRAYDLVLSRLGGRNSREMELLLPHSEAADGLLSGRVAAEEAVCGTQCLF